MDPALREGDVVTLVAAARRPPRLGDVVLTSVEGGFRLHRLVWTPPGGRWRTKADRAPTWDPVSKDDLIATAIEVRSGREGASDATRETAAAIPDRGGGGPLPSAVGTPRPPLKPPQLADVFARSDRIVGRRIAGEYVLVPLVGRGTDADFIYTLNRVAAAIWEALDGKASGEDVVRHVVDHYEVAESEAAADYLDLVETLESIEAVRRL